MYSVCHNHNTSAEAFGGGGPRQLGVPEYCEGLLFSARISVRGRALTNRQRCPLVSTARVRACALNKTTTQLGCCNMSLYPVLVHALFLHTVDILFFGPMYSTSTTDRSFADQTPGSSTLSVPVQTVGSMSGKQRSD